MSCVCTTGGTQGGKPYQIVNFPHTIVVHLATLSEWVLKAPTHVRCIKKYEVQKVVEKQLDPEETLKLYKEVDNDSLMDEDMMAVKARALRRPGSNASLT